MLKHSTKLIFAFILLIVAFTMIVASTYAWLNISTNPAADGIKVAVAGGNTILVAPDITSNEYGEVCHFPGEFSERLDFESNVNYDYLKNLSGLTPVSTADGIHWFYPVYNGLTGHTDTGRIGGYAEDTDMLHANLTESSEVSAAEAHYAFLDFWVVAPAAEYTLRVSTVPENSNTYVLSVPKPVEAENGGFELDSGNAVTEACLRVGFLTNNTVLGTPSMLSYTQSERYSDRYRSLRGEYENISTSGEGQFKFTIFEPNADLHPTDELLNGAYITTEPIVSQDGSVADIRDRVTVQRHSSWNRTLHESFAAVGQGIDSIDGALNLFKNDFEGRLSGYAESGSFVSSTRGLYDAADMTGGTVASDVLQKAASGGAAEDISIVKLEKNVPQRIRMFVWLEGQDADCVNSAADAGISINIEFAGGN